MPKHTKTWILVGIMLATVGSAGSALAISDADACDEQGGVYENYQGTKTCTITTSPGNNQGGVTKDESHAVKGSFSSSHPHETEDCVNNNGGSHC